MTQFVLAPAAAPCVRYQLRIKGTTARAQSPAAGMQSRAMYSILMNLQLNHLNAKAAAITPIVVETIHKLVEDGQIDPAQFASLQVQLDWIQYKQNFREMVSVANIVDRGNAQSERRPRAIDMRIDTRQVTPETLRPEMLRALAA